MSNAKSEILSRLRLSPIADVPLPEVIEGDWLSFDDPVSQFQNMVRTVGGSCEVVDSIDEVRALLNGFEVYRDAKHIYSQVEGIENQVDLAGTADARDLADLDFVIYPGEFGVAENGAVWVTDQGLSHRVIFFITQHLVMIVRRENIISNMHQAYDKLSFEKPGFGLFISGPSKTADIEQSLVIGAHGCRSLQVYILN